MEKQVLSAFYTDCLDIGRGAGDSPVLVPGNHVAPPCLSSLIAK